MSPNREKRREAYGGKPRFESDSDMGIVAIHGWGVRKSAGFEVLQIITKPEISRLETRSQQYEKEPPEWMEPYWFRN